MDVSVRVHGARELRAALKRAGLALEDLKEANQRVAVAVATAAASRAPRRSGLLAYRTKGNRAAGKATVSVPGVPYAAPIHWGWPARGIEAQPFIAAAAQDTEPAWIGVYQSEIDKILDRV